MLIEIIYAIAEVIWHKKTRIKQSIDELKAIKEAFDDVDALGKKTIMEKSNYPKVILIS